MFSYFFSRDHPLKNSDDAIFRQISKRYSHLFLLFSSEFSLLRGLGTETPLASTPTNNNSGLLEGPEIVISTTSPSPPYYHHHPYPSLPPIASHRRLGTTFSLPAAGGVSYSSATLPSPVRRRGGAHSDDHEAMLRSHKVD
jgi:hypothetical protein